MARGGRGLRGGRGMPQWTRPSSAGKSRWRAVHAEPMTDDPIHERYRVRGDHYAAPQPFPARFAYSDRLYLQRQPGSHYPVLVARRLADRRFNGAEVLLAVVLLRAHARTARASEFLVLSASELLICRTDGRGRRSEQRLPSAWINVLVEERQGRVPGLYLAARGERLEIGAALGEPEKRDLAGALSSALHQWRNPVFDNPQLSQA